MKFWPCKFSDKLYYKIISELTHFCVYIFIYIYMLLLVFFVWQLRWLWAEVVACLYDALYVPAHLLAKPTCWYMPRMNMEMIEDHSAVLCVVVLPRIRTVYVFMYICTIGRTVMNERQHSFTDLFSTFQHNFSIYKCFKCTPFSVSWYWCAFCH